MKSVETEKNPENTNNNLFKDFYTVPNLKFDVEKLRSDLDRILKLKKFNSLGIKNFAAIPLNQIPGDKSSIEGHNVRGTYWTIPDETGKEAKRDKPIDESKYTELVQEFKGTYFEEVFNILRTSLRDSIISTSSSKERSPSSKTFFIALMFRPLLESSFIFKKMTKSDFWNILLLEILLTVK